MSGAAIQINYSISNNDIVGLYLYYAEHYYMFCNVDEKKIIDSFIIGGVRDLSRNNVYPNESWLEEFTIQDNEDYLNNNYLILMDEARHIWNNYYGKCLSIVSGLNNRNLESEMVEKYLTQWIVKKAINYFIKIRSFGGENFTGIYIPDNLVKEIVQNLPMVDSDYLMTIEQYLEHLVKKDILERKNDTK